jgi:hypothetical protein
VLGPVFFGQGSWLWAGAINGCHGVQPKWTGSRDFNGSAGVLLARHHKTRGALSCAGTDYWFNAALKEGRWNMPPSCAWQRVEVQVGGHGTRPLRRALVSCCVCSAMLTCLPRKHWHMVPDWPCRLQRAGRPLQVHELRDWANG